MNELKDKVLEILNTRYISHKGLSKLADIVAKMLRVSTNDVFVCLNDLIKSGDVFEFAKNKFAGCKLLGLVKGKFVNSTSHFGFVLNEAGDIYISKKNIHGAFDGDVVLAKITGQAYKEKKREGKILKILSRDNDRLVGTFREIKGYGYVSLDRKNIEVRVEKKDSLNAKDEDKVVIDITGYKSGNPVGRVVEVIGNLKDKGNDIKWLLRQYKVRDVFPQEVLLEAKKVPQVIDKDRYKSRRDLTDEMLFTIDGADAKDLDDAVSLTKNNDGTYLLGVHIADVGEYVRLDSIIDKEAFIRGTSIYFLDQVIPMLPKELSNGICSLNPNVERLALSVEMKIDKNGEVLDSKIFESIIKSKHRLNYDEVLKLIEGDKETRKRLSDITQTLLDMYELSQILDNRRQKYGALNFELPEGEIVLDSNNQAIDVVKRVATKSTKVIETFMVVANETIAKTFDNLKIPFVYRVHEKPDSEKIATFFNFIDTLGLKIPQGARKEIEPKDLQGILVQVENQSIESVVNMVMLRSLKKAKYMDKCLGHFGMALNYYCHFTSPIRRYPDLTIHRIIKEYLHGNNSFIKSNVMSEFVVKSSEKSSEQERLAEDVERAITDYKKCEYMAKFIGKTFEGIISSVTQRGFYVELDNTCEGLVGISTLKDDFYDFDEERMCLVSKNNIYRIGEKVEVKVVDTNPQERKINFELVRKIR